MKLWIHVTCTGAVAATTGLATGEPITWEIFKVTLNGSWTGFWAVGLAGAGPNVNDNAPAGIWTVTPSIFNVFVVPSVQPNFL